jgi:hypothetical protein
MLMNEHLMPLEDDDIMVDASSVMKSKTNI